MSLECDTKYTVSFGRIMLEGYGVVEAAGGEGAADYSEHAGGGNHNDSLWEL